MNLIRAKSDDKAWGLQLGELARIWKGGCIIRAAFLDDIKVGFKEGRGPSFDEGRGPSFGGAHGLIEGWGRKDAAFHVDGKF